MFGEVAFDKGHVSAAQLYEALTIQARLEIQGKTRKFLGEILVELGYLTEQQVLEILTYLHAGRSPESSPGPRPNIKDEA